MSRIVKMVAALASAMALAACAPKGGGGGPASLDRPVEVVMTSRMTTGKGIVTLTPRGLQVEVAIHAEALPPPATYSLWLVRPDASGGDNLATIRAEDGRIDFAGTFPAERFAGWREIMLLHQPSGIPADLRQGHPALVGALPPEKAWR